MLSRMEGQVFWLKKQLESEQADFRAYLQQLDIAEETLIQEVEDYFFIKKGEAEETYQTPLGIEEEEKQSVDNVIMEFEGQKGSTQDMSYLLNMLELNKKLTKISYTPQNIQTTLQNLQPVIQAIH